MWKRIYSWANGLSGKQLSSLITVVMVLLIIILGYTSWQVKRWFNYSWGYESQVKTTATNTVCAMVKPEFLVYPKKCK